MVDIMQHAAKHQELQDNSKKRKEQVKHFTENMELINNLSAGNIFSNDKCVLDEELLQFFKGTEKRGRKFVSLGSQKLLLITERRMQQHSPFSRRIKNFTHLKCNIIEGDY